MKGRKKVSNSVQQAEERRKVILNILKAKSPQTTQELKQHFPETCLSSFRNDLGILKQRKKINLLRENESPLVWEYLSD